MPASRSTKRSTKTVNVSSLQSYKFDEIPNLKRRQLQTLAKANSIKANSKNIKLVKDLQKKWKEIVSDASNQENKSINSNRKKVKNLSPKPMQSPHKIVVHKSPNNISEIEPSPQKQSQKFEVQMQTETENETEPETDKIEMQILSSNDSDYNANPNGNNGSLIDINDEDEYDQSDTVFHSNDNENSTVYTNHNTTDISTHNINNGSMIETVHIPMIVNNDIDEMNENTKIQITKMEQSQTQSESNNNNSSLSLEGTPKLNDTIEEFVRKSLNPDHEEDSANNKQFIEDEYETEDVDMEETPTFSLTPNRRIETNNNNTNLSLAQELNMNNTSMLSMNASRISVKTDDINQNLNESMNTDSSMNESMLGMNASRVSVNENNESNVTNESNISADSEEEMWKKTPLKALQILDSIRDSISMESGSKSNDFNEKIEAEAEETKPVMKIEIECESETQTQTQKRERKPSVVENLFYLSPVTKPFQSPKRSNRNSNRRHRNIVTPKSEIIQGKHGSRKISMTFGDGQTLAFKSVYSQSPNPSPHSKAGKAGNASNSRSLSAVSSTRVQKRRKSTSNALLSRSTIQTNVRMPTPESLCEKTTIIRQMFDEEINKSNHCKGRAAPDWNRIHNRQIFSRQPDLREWNDTKQKRTQKLFATNQKMSTPNYRKRSQSMIGKRINKLTHSETKINKNQKRVTILPSQNDHLYNHNKDGKLNRKVFRKATPYKHISNMSEFGVSNNKKASKKPRFSTSISESVSNESTNSKECVIAKKDLAFDPDKVQSRLFHGTSASKAKKKSAQTPQIMRSNHREKKENKSINKSKQQSRNWSAVKSKVNSNYNGNGNGNGNSNNAKVSGVKRKLSWGSEQKSGVTEPEQKKRRITVNPKNDTMKE